MSAPTRVFSEKEIAAIKYSLEVERLSIADCAKKHAITRHMVVILSDRHGIKRRKYDAEARGENTRKIFAERKAKREKRTRRKCMCCNGLFLSAGNGNRLCNGCRTKTEGYVGCNTNYIGMGYGR